MFGLLEEQHRGSSHRLIGHFFTAEIRALTLGLVNLTGLYGLGGTAIWPLAVVMEGSMLMINVVTTLNSCSFTVDKNKSKPSSRQQPPQQPASQQNGIPTSVTECGRKDKSIQQLKGLLTASNCRFEAVAIVLQKTLAEVRKFDFYYWNFFFFFNSIFQQHELFSLVFVTGKYPINHTQLPIEF